MDALLGVGFLLGGVHSLASKTFFLPTKFAHDEVSAASKLTEAKIESITVSQGTHTKVDLSESSSPSTGCLAWLPSKKFLGISAVGGVAGYFGGTYVPASLMATWIGTWITPPYLLLLVPSQALFYYLYLLTAVYKRQIFALAHAQHQGQHDENDVIYGAEESTRSY